MDIFSSTLSRQLLELELFIISENIDLAKAELSPVEQELLLVRNSLRKGVNNIWKIRLEELKDKEKIGDVNKSTRHGVAENVYLLEQNIAGNFAIKMRWPDMFVIDFQSSEIKLVEVKSIRPGKGREKLSEEQKICFKFIENFLGVKVEVKYVELKG